MVRYRLTFPDRGSREKSTRNTSFRNRRRKPHQQQSRPRRILTVGTRWLVWAYVAVILATLVAVQWSTDRWWLTTLLAFGPKWILLCPLVVLFPLAALFRARLTPLLLLAGAAFCLVVMGFNVPFSVRPSDLEHRERIVVMTCNLGGTADWKAIHALIEKRGVDIIACQELGTSDPLFPPNWYSERQGRLLIASRFPITDTKKWIRHDPPQQWPPLIALHAVIEAPGRSLSLCNLHLTSPHHGLAALLDRKMIINPARRDRLQQLIALREQESRALRAWIDQQPETDLIVGDFNMPVQSQIYRRYWQDYINAFNANQWGFGLTRQVTLGGISFGARIDHILTGPRGFPIDCQIGPDVGSDHLPVFAEVVIRPVDD